MVSCLRGENLKQISANTMLVSQFLNVSSLFLTCGLPGRLQTTVNIFGQSNYIKVTTLPTQLMKLLYSCMFYYFLLLLPAGNRGSFSIYFFCYHGEASLFFFFFLLPGSCEPPHLIQVGLSKEEYDSSKQHCWWQGNLGTLADERFLQRFQGSPIL